MASDKFYFVNTSKDHVKITQIKTSCGCTTAGAEKAEFAPGERSSIPVEYKFGKSTGFQEKEIIVVTNEDPPASYVLKLKTYIPKVLDVAPIVLSWTSEEGPVCKTVTLTSAASKPINIVEATSTSDIFKVTLSELRDGAQFAVKVTPRILKSGARGAIEVSVKVEGMEGEKIVKIPLRIDSKQNLPESSK